MKEIEKGYYVDENGNVFSNRKFNEITKLKTYKDINGYLRVKINNQTKKVHRLIAISYLSNIDNKATVNHKNGNKEDNRVVNLEWATHKENTKHSYDTNIRKPYIGTKDHGNNKYRKEWENLIKEGKSLRCIGKIYGVSHHTVKRTITK